MRYSTASKRIGFGRKWQLWTSEEQYSSSRHQTCISLFPLLFRKFLGGLRQVQEIQRWKNRGCNTKLCCSSSITGAKGTMQPSPIPYTMPALPSLAYSLRHFIEQLEGISQGLL
ncbi:BAHD acyltransferase [Pyrus ussuriensis x Pyrus communis]|uniref:BAHD acyltransferase n=1 Tax=Pyrus ussuriensis x Pyrus communis TaxID=2448454 RepID=A0A5N5F4Y9_9ROSA|nr:BAHD acyltransferase [Pyrus ussuriensis x Pyrus communis]